MSTVVIVTELAAKMAELCGWGVPVSVRCQLPTEDLDALVSVTSDEDLANLLEEYDLASRDKDSPLKVKAFLAPQQLQHHHPAPMKAPATPPSSAIRGNNSPFAPSAAERCARHAAHRLPPQQFSCSAASSSRLPIRPPMAMCYGQAHHQYCYEHHHNRTCVIHGGAGGGPGAATSYRLAMLS
ncbi:hypothetical protein Taro_026021 [Colocasia esculenta]|uniref:PB1 domain-containing protein n=1 Tax=Colocasia esculenta TaxID=4460 RepID=A0A843VIB9_COLES|nr:hypothetical protein [Colocasia esculenta]